MVGGLHSPALPMALTHPIPHHRGHGRAHTCSTLPCLWLSPREPSSLVPFYCCFFWSHCLSHTLTLLSDSSQEPQAILVLTTHLGLFSSLIIHRSGLALPQVPSFCRWWEGLLLLASAHRTMVCTQPPLKMLGRWRGKMERRRWEESAVYLIQILTPAARISQSLSSLWISPNAGL